MTMLKQRAVVAAKQETTEGTYETLAAADAFLAFNLQFKPGQAMHKRDPERPSLSPMPSIPGKRSATLSFGTELVGAAAAGTAPFWGKLIKPCGFAETIVASTSVTYEPASISIPSMSLGFWLDGKKHLLWGARGNVSLKLEGGMPGMLNWEFTGADWSEADEALLSPTYDATLPPVFQDANFTIDSFAAVINLLEVNMNNTVALRPDASASSGHKSALITNRNEASMSFDPENDLKSIYDFLGKWQAGTLLAMSSSFGSAAGNTFAVSAPKVQFQEISLNEREGVSALSIETLLTMDSGDDEFKIMIT